jgi:hypothetical protein
MRWSLAALLLTAAALAAGCRPQPAPRPQPADSAAARGPDMPAAALAEVLARHTPGLLAIPGVNGTGEGLENGVPVLVVFVEKKTADLEARLPKRIEGHPVVIRETGVVTPYPR